MEEGSFGSPEANRIASQKEMWLSNFAQSFATCKFNKVKGCIDSGQMLSKFLLSQFKLLFDAEKMFLQMRFHAPQSKILFFQSTKEPSTASIFQNIVRTANQPGTAAEDVEILVDLASFATIRLAFIEFLVVLAEDQSTTTVMKALKQLGSHAAVIPPTSTYLSPIFDRIRIEFKAMYHTFETLQLINNLRYIDALIALQQAFARFEELDVSAGMTPSVGGTLVGPVGGSTAGDSWQRFYMWLKSALSHFVGKFCTFFYTAVGHYLTPDVAASSLSSNTLPGLLARSSYPDLIGRFFTMAKRFSVEMLILICDHVGDKAVIEPSFKLDLDSPQFLPSSDLHVLMSYWPSDPSNDPNSPAATSSFNRYSNFILKLLTQHRLREVPYTSIELQSAITVLTSVDSSVFLICSYTTKGSQSQKSRDQKGSQVLSAVTELTSILRCKNVFSTLKEACLPPT